LDLRRQRLTMAAEDMLFIPSHYISSFLINILFCVGISFYAFLSCLVGGLFFEGVKEEVACVVVSQRDEQVAMSVLPTDVDVL
jgi:hypothetical protein